MNMLKQIRLHTQDRNLTGMKLNLLITSYGSFVMILEIPQRDPEENSLNHQQYT